MLQLLHMTNNWTEYLQKDGQIDTIYTTTDYTGAPDHT